VKSATGNRLKAKVTIKIYFTYLCSRHQTLSFHHRFTLLIVTKFVLPIGKILL
jgi:hypothetical protein